MKQKLPFRARRMLALCKGKENIDDSDEHESFRIRCMGCGIRFGVNQSNFEMIMREHKCEYDILDRFREEFQNTVQGKSLPT